MPTRSTKLASVKPVAGVELTVLTVPAGYTYLVKEVVVTNTGVAADAVYVFAQDGGVVQAHLFSNQSIPASSRAEWDGWLALNPGDVIKVDSSTGTSHFWFSGTKLPGVA